jgi:hypothetical protein
MSTTDYTDLAMRQLDIIQSEDGLYVLRTTSISLVSLLGVIAQANRHRCNFEDTRLIALEMNQRREVEFPTLKDMTIEAVSLPRRKGIAIILETSGDHPDYRREWLRNQGNPHNRPIPKLPRGDEYSSFETNQEVLSQFMSHIGDVGKAINLSKIEKAVEAFNTPPDNQIEGAFATTQVIFVGNVLIKVNPDETLEILPHFVRKKI